MAGARAWQERVRSLAPLLSAQAGVVHRRQLAERGWTYAQVEAQIRAGRWRRGGRMTVIAYTGPPTRSSRWWRAVLEVGPSAALAGPTALQASGLRGIDEGALHVVAPKSSRPRHPRGVVVHETRRLLRGDVVGSGVPRLGVAPAALFAALWAVSDRQAALYLVAPVQQRLTEPLDLAHAAERIRRHPRRGLITAVISDLATGAESLGELDFAGLCRRHGLPEPTRQRVVHHPGGRYYLDADWEEWGVAVEIDGDAHRDAKTWVDDAWRQNEVVITGRVVLRFPQVTVRVDPARVMAQTRAALVRRGWRPGR